MQRALPVTAAVVLVALLLLLHLRHSWRHGLAAAAGAGAAHGAGDRSSQAGIMQGFEEHVMPLLLLHSLDGFLVLITVGCRLAGWPHRHLNAT